VKTGVIAPRKYVHESQVKATRSARISVNSQLTQKLRQYSLLVQKPRVQLLIW
jgi:hypothetical protein